jgi:hypothetical protein
MATTFDTESEAQATAAKLNAAGTRDIRYQVGRYGEKWEIAPEQTHILGLGRVRYDICAAPA